MLINIKELISKNSAKKSIGDTLLQVERDQLQYLQNKRHKSDEDDVRKLSTYNKMEYRIRVLQITQTFLYPDRRISLATRNISSRTRRPVLDLVLILQQNRCLQDIIMIPLRNF